MNATSCLRMWAAIALILTASACRSATPPTYYSLSTDGPSGKTASTEGARTLVGLGPIVLPAYLDRHQMVIRTSPHELRIDDHHVWAAPLSEELPRVLAENLMRAKPSLRVARRPWDHRFVPEIIISVQISSFEARSDGRVSLNAVVTMSGRSEATWSIQLEDQAANHSRSDLVAAQSRLLEEFSRRIVDAMPAGL
jgi:uncharacterized protein